jgi:hypothetical protein
MSQEERRDCASASRGLARRKRASVIAAMFSENVVVEIPGDAAALPWI